MELALSAALCLRRCCFVLAILSDLEVTPFRNGLTLGAELGIGHTECCIEAA